MLEILALIFLVKKIGDIARQKGHKSGKYQFFTVILWFGGEFLGAIIGAIMAGGSSDAQCLIYMVALAGAATGAFIAYQIVNGLPSVVGPSELPETSSVVPVSSEEQITVDTVRARIAAGLCPKCGKPVSPSDQNCPSCRINLAWARQNPEQLANRK